jgi:hypothetical protein
MVFMGAIYAIVLSKNYGVDRYGVTLSLWESLLGLAGRVCSPLSFVVCLEELC